jgi:hypothetical protein
MRRWLANLVEQGLIVQHGTGRKNDAYRYETPKADAESGET